MAASAAGAEPRIARAALILAGGDLSKIIHHARETRELSAMIRALPESQQVELQQKLAAVDPLCAAEQLQPRARAGKVLMINAAEDEVIPRDCTERLAAALGVSDRVVWLDGLGHYTAMAVLPQALNQTADFFAQDLPPGVKPAEAVTPRQTPQQRIAGVLLQVAQMIGADPQPGRSHMLDAAAEATLPDGQRVRRGAAIPSRPRSQVPAARRRLEARRRHLGPRRLSVDGPERGNRLCGRAAGRQRSRAIR